MEETRTGLFGKLPAHGDFVRRVLPRSFVAPWDAWLSEGIAIARDRLGEDWEAVWQAAPPWRFRLSPGACGPDAAFGVVVTSADTVGRYFPLTLATVLPMAGLPPPEEWYEALEAAALNARDGGLDADALAASLPDPPPDEDIDATLDGRSVFWSPGQPSRAMPAPADFLLLLERHVLEQPET
ncbi:type VI secretion system-associated protein TagF [Roseococcus sp.]|uniref:type VI secretion system-associated protein TagF n=1 Tax=Roseococcus sp. TaxID=2109646 RepID=UPI003BAAB344